MEDFRRVVEINLIGTFNLLRSWRPAPWGWSRWRGASVGVLITTASIAAYDGQVGQPAYAASKAGVAGLTLPAAREFAGVGIRCVVTIAPGIFATPMMLNMPQEVQDSIGATVPFPPGWARRRIMPVWCSTSSHTMLKRGGDPPRRGVAHGAEVRIKRMYRVNMRNSAHY